MCLSPVFERLNLTQAEFRKDLGLSRSAASRLITHGLWPRRAVADFKKDVEEWLRLRGATDAEIEPLYSAAELAEKRQADSAARRAAISAECAARGKRTAASVKAERVEEETRISKEELMAIRNETLSPEARRHFSLTRNPFLDDIQTVDDVYQTPSVRYVRAALMDCAQHSGFLAVVGESGAGKSTLAEDLGERIKAEGRDIIIIRPYVTGMEADDRSGKPMRSSQVADAIAHALDPRVKLPAAPNQQFAAVHKMLLDSHRAGTRHLILIEEAHCMPREMLRHLKRFLELKDGLRRTLGVALIAQPELLDILNTNSKQIREVVQRLEIIKLDPLDSELEGYLGHKFGRAGVALKDVMTDDAIDAIRARLVSIPRGGSKADAQSNCHPLAVQNLVSRAMNAAAKVGWKQVTAEVIAGC
ncbi:ExeA family protein [Diaphorobacter caeni]|uniref:ExeA family protein n=1 Tax=Diaphorobacter caeni TaxID=2784387 RepID=UPI001890437F|nr:AAA family ATPase [Diaphorobacter caeni]MBF5006375.1 AAA family ATPase [Diaphorobacter caeni]